MDRDRAVVFGEVQDDRMLRRVGIVDGLRSDKRQRTGERRGDCGLAFQVDVADA
jgi:hypothetical protein